MYFARWALGEFQRKYSGAGLWLPTGSPWRRAADSPPATLKFTQNLLVETEAEKWPQNAERMSWNFGKYLAVHTSPGELCPQRNENNGLGCSFICILC